MNIDGIIKESINRVITEGYSGKYAEYWMNKDLMPKISRWLKAVKANKPSVDRKFTARVYTNGYSFDKTCSMMMRGRNTYTVYITICYFPDKRFEHGAGGETNTPQDSSDKTIDVLLNINNEAGLPIIYRSLIHEFTHVTDFVLGMRNGNNGYYGHKHQVELGYQLPPCIMYVMYYLWDTSEFSAYQAYVNSDIDLFNEHFEEIMKYLNKANEINNEKTWANLRKYLAEKVDLKMGKRTTAWIKKYFIDTSFKLLKNFTKKVDV